MFSNKGLRIAALYSFPPHRFGLCGMKKGKSEEMEAFLAGKKVPEIKEIMKSFKGAFFYYQLIAKENKIKNPFDKKVVRAYWIGNELLKKVKIKKLREMVARDFKKKKLAKNLPENSFAHHSFHVLVAGPIDKNLILTEGMKDLCKISWGGVLKISKNKMPVNELLVEYQPLLKEKEWYLGKFVKRKIFWKKSILPKLKKGDIISFHWDLALEKLSKKDLENLKKYTQDSIKIANFLNL